MKMRLNFDIPSIEPPSFHPVFEKSLLEDLVVSCLYLIKQNVNYVYS